MHRLAIAALAFLTLTAGCASRPEGEDQRRGANDGSLSHAAATPLRDVGIIRPDVPDMLRTLNYPYKTDTVARDCPAILVEIGRLDAILGVESYQPGQEQHLAARISGQAGDYAVGAVAGAAADLVPYRSFVRRLSGASAAERRAAAAYAMGETRRSFLRGYGLALNCPGVTPAPPPG